MNNFQYMMLFIGILIIVNLVVYFVSFESMVVIILSAILANLLRIGIESEVK